MALLDRRNGEQGIIEGRFIQHVLQDQGKEIYGDIRKLQKRYNFKSNKWFTSSYSVSDKTMTYEHIAAQRFVDIKTRRVKGYRKGTRKVPPGKINKKIVFAIHNKPIWTHKKFIIKTLSFGFTEEVMENFRRLAKDEGLI